MNALLVVFFLCPVAAATLPWPFSFATVPTLAFPGALPRFFTTEEVANFVSNFSSMNIWGLNVLCAGPNSTTTPATCPPGDLAASRDRTLIRAGAEKSIR